MKVKEGRMIGTWKATFARPEISDYHWADLIQQVRKQFETSLTDYPGTGVNYEATLHVTPEEIVVKTHNTSVYTWAEYVRRVYVIYAKSGYYIQLLGRVSKVEPN